MNFLGLDFIVEEPKVGQQPYSKSLFSACTTKKIYNEKILTEGCLASITLSLSFH
jgi:hypothetical protein